MTFKLLDYGNYYTREQVEEVKTLLGRPPGLDFTPIQEARLRRCRDLLMHGGAEKGELFELISGQRDNELEVPEHKSPGRPRGVRTGCKDCDTDITGGALSKWDRARCKACASKKKAQYNKAYRGAATTAG